MPEFRLRRHKGEDKNESAPVTTADRIGAAVRILLVVMLAVRLVRAVRKMPADIALLRTPAPTAA